MNGEHLKDGIIEVYGMAIGRDTTGDDFRKSLTGDDRLLESTISGQKHWFLLGRRSTDIAGHSFQPQLHFRDDSSHMFILRPLMDQTGKDVLADQAARHTFCENVLRTLLGEPDRKEELCTAYEFPWGTVAVVSHPLNALVSERQSPAGYIVVRYKPQLH